MAMFLGRLLADVAGTCPLGGVARLSGPLFGGFLVNWTVIVKQGQPIY